MLLAAGVVVVLPLSASFLLNSLLAQKLKVHPCLLLLSWLGAGGDFSLFANGLQQGRGERGLLLVAFLRNEVCPIDDLARRHGS